MDLYPGHFTYSFVRNPCRRFLSRYRHAGRYPEMRTAYTPNHPASNGTLREFTELCAELLADTANFRARARDGVLPRQRAAALRSPGHSAAPSRVRVRPCPAADARPCGLQRGTAVRVAATPSHAGGFHRRGRIDRCRLPAGAGGARLAPTSARPGVSQGHDSEVPGLNLRDRTVPLPGYREALGPRPARSRTHPGPWLRSPAGIRSPGDTSHTVPRCRLRTSACAASPTRMTFRCPTDEDSRFNARPGAAPAS